ncbi:MAG: tRNA (guanosine(46)-N7)-methyltransferase TrmB, partial [Alphaproteobacteria bacterium]|nr:tRNA (guanosine(46)-N7)-methyltransferase TrmB [Alphaproteobacteria bacterium]
MEGDERQSDEHRPVVHEVRSFGRRRGRKRSARQDSILRDGLAQWGLDLEGPLPPEPHALFSPTPPEVWMEIGFGGGEHLIWQAERNPDVGFIAAEPFEDGVVKALTAIAEKHLKNVRIYPGDVRPVLRSLPQDSIARAFVLFPDPWP